MTTAIVVGGGGFQGLPVIRGLHAIGWRALVADSVSSSLNQFEADCFVHIHEAKHYEEFSTDLLTVAKRHGVNAAFPTTMYDLPALAKLKPQLKALGVQVFTSTPELIDLLSNKVKTMVAASDGGLPVLPIVDPAKYDFSSPLIGKPPMGWGGNGIVKSVTRQKWQEAVLNGGLDGYLWQPELVEFCEWSVDFALREDGYCSPIVCRRRLRATGGFAVLSEIEEALLLERLALQTAAWLAERGGCGIFNIQFLEEPNGSIWLNDVNPRPGTSSVCALVGGINLVGFLLNEDGAFASVRSGLVIRTLADRFVPKFPKQINGVVFDLDETLICQKRWMQAKLEIVLAGLQGAIDPLQLSFFRLEALRLIDEGPWSQLIDIALERSGCHSNLATSLIDMWRAASPGNIFLHQDAVAFLQALQELNIPIALLSDNPVASQRQKIDMLPKEIEFKSIVLTDELSHPKPHADGFLVAANRLSLPPENLLMVGDSPWRDGLGALQAGYGGALLVRRVGSMTNAQKDIFDINFPEYQKRIIWTDSLYGMDRALTGDYMG